MSWTSRIASNAAELAGKARQNVSRFGKFAPRVRGGGGGSGKTSNRIKTA